MILCLNAGSKLNTFGSFEYDFFSRWADLDLSLELSNRDAFEQISKKEKLKVLQSFLNDVIRRGASLHFVTCVIYYYYLACVSMIYCLYLVLLEEGKP